MAKSRFNHLISSHQDTISANISTLQRYIFIFIWQQKHGKSRKNAQQSNRTETPGHTPLAAPSFGAKCGKQE